VAAQLEQKAVEVFLPAFSILSRWKDRRVRVANPVFSSYLFTRIDLRDRIRAVSTPSVIRIVPSKARPLRSPTVKLMLSGRAWPEQTLSLIHLLRWESGSECGRAPSKEYQEL